MRACVLLAPGFEEIEAVTIIDVLRRGEIDTEVLGVDATEVTGSHLIELKVDRLLSDAMEESWDLVVLPGGIPGATNLRDSDRVQRFLGRLSEAGAKIAAICAAPIALSKGGLLKDKTATSYPAFEDQVKCGRYVRDRVVVDGDVITSRGPGTALDFALELVAQLRDRDAAAALAERMLTTFS